MIPKSGLPIFGKDHAEMSGMIRKSGLPVFGKDHAEMKVDTGALFKRHHCKRSDAIQLGIKECFVAPLLAMTR